MRELARQLQAQGRGEDSILIHMTPGEVKGLQALAMAHGGTLTVNPTTGLPEAGFLSKILPTLLGVGLSFIPGVGPLMAAGLVGGGTGLATGSLEKGLMAGLGAFGGASLGTALGAGTGQGFLGGIGDKISNVFGGGATPAVTTAPAAISPYTMGSNAIASDLAFGAAAPTAGVGAGAQAPGFIDKIVAGGYGVGPNAPASELAKYGFGEGQTVGLRGYGALGGLALPLFQQEPGKGPKEEEEYSPISEYRPLPPRQVSYPGPGYGSREYNYFNPSTYPFAKGGEVHLKDGSFVLDARTVSEVGNGSSSAGQARLGPLGGIPIKGPGDGVSDSIPATIGGKQQARVARDEVMFSPEAVRRIGRGNERRGAQKLYGLMDKAHRERRAVKRGEPNKGLGALLK